MDMMEEGHATIKKKGNLSDVAKKFGKPTVKSINVTMISFIAKKGSLKSDPSDMNTEDDDKIEADNTTGDWNFVHVDSDEEDWEIIHKIDHEDTLFIG